MSDPITPRDGDDPTDLESWPDTSGPSALKRIEAASGPVPRVVLREDAAPDAAAIRAEPPAPGEFRPPDLGRYTILGEIARGGMGAILRGRDADLNRDLAIKVLLEKYAENVEILGRFIEEAQIGGQLQHPGIVPVYELGQFPDRRPFFAMKLVKGRTLSDLLKERASPADNLPRFLKIFEQICETMAYAHSKGVIHRDLKPLNVMVGAFGEVQVMDWGLAKLLDRKAEPEPLATQPHASVIRTERSETGSNPTMYGDFMGTAAYMPPEQARGEIDRLDARTDVFALGSILCEILTGLPAYRGGAIADRAKVGDLDDARARLDACGCEPDLIAIATVCLARIAEDRPSDASEVARLTTAYLSGVQERLRASEIARAEADARAEAEEAKAEAERSQAKAERARADSERARRKTTVALAAAVLLAGLIGGGSWAAFKLDRQSKLAEADQIIGEALARAQAAQSEAERAGMEAAETWTRALDAADRAKGLLAVRPPRDTLARDVVKTYDAVVKSAAASLERVHQIEADRRLLVALDEARLQMAAVKDSGFDWESKLAAYEAAFRDAGVDFDKQPPEEIAARLLPKRDLPRIAATLDDWATYRGEKRRDTIVSVARAIDPERNPLRSALAGKDRATLVAMARGPTARQMPATTACQLAEILENLGDRDDAISLLSAARSRSSTDFWINHDLGVLLLHSNKSGEMAEAVRFLTVAAVLRPDSPGAHHNLGLALRDGGRPGEAIDAYREAIRLKSDFAESHVGLGTALNEQGQHDLAIDAFREALRLKPNFPEASFNLGHTLEGQGLRDEAIVVYREAIRLKPSYPEIHFGLGFALLTQGKHGEAAESLRRAIDLKPDLAEAHAVLGLALQSQGQFAEALIEARKGHEMGSKQPDWSFPSELLIAECESMIALEARLPAILRSEESPKDNSERLMLGQLCYYTRRFAASARFWGDALIEDPKLAEDRQTERGYGAACSAVLASTGQGKDDPKPDDMTKAKLRQQAGEWLRTELSIWEKVIMTAEPGNKALATRKLRHWKADTDLAGVRDADALAKLPEPERAEWRKLWDDVDSLLAKAAKP